MNELNYVFLIIGGFVILIGALGLLNPNWTRLINFPGGPRIKAFGAMISGLILLILGILLDIPMN